MLNKFKFFIASIVVLNLTTLPLKSQAQCTSQYYMIDENSNCIDLTNIGGTKLKLRNQSPPVNQTPSVNETLPPPIDSDYGDNNQPSVLEEEMANSEQTEQDSPEKLELTYAIKEKENKIEYLKTDNEKLEEQIKVSCAKLSSLDFRKFCQKQRKSLGAQIKENKETIVVLEKEIKDLSLKADSL